MSDIDLLDDDPDPFPRTRNPYPALLQWCEIPSYEVLTPARRARGLREFADQNGECAICGEYRGEDLVVDHDHRTGELRGLLCQECNIGLGWFKDCWGRLQLAAKYIKRSERRQRKV